MTLLRSLIVLGCAISVIGLPAAAVALFNTETYSGTLCQPSKSSSAVQYTQYGFVNNGTANAIQAECPFPLTRTSDLCPGPGRHFKFAHIVAYVYDRHPTQNVTCTLRVLDFDGDRLTGGEFTRSSISNLGQVQALVFPQLTAELAVGYALHMSCNVPPKVGNSPSAVTTYEVGMRC